MDLGRLVSIFARFALLAACASGTPAFALDCPDPHSVASRGDSPGDAGARSRRPENVWRAAIRSKTTSAVLADLRARYPKADGAEFVNYIITAYRPVIDAQPSLSEAEKKARLELSSSNCWRRYIKRPLARKREFAL